MEPKTQLRLWRFPRGQNSCAAGAQLASGSCLVHPTVERIDEQISHLTFSETKRPDTEHSPHSDPDEPCHDRSNHSCREALVVTGGLVTLSANEWRRGVGIYKGCPTGQGHWSGKPPHIESLEGNSFCTTSIKIIDWTLPPRSNSLKRGRSRQFIVELPRRGELSSSLTGLRFPPYRWVGHSVQPQKQPGPRKCGSQVPLVPVSGCG